MVNRGNVLMVAHSYCPGDPRVRREAEALAGAGWGVDVLCLMDAGQRWRETVNGVRYLRFPLRRRRGGVLRYAFEYAALLVLGVAAAVALHGFRRYRLVQAHNMPDFLVFCGIVPWFTGVPLLLDLHDPIPELYRSKFLLPPEAPLIRVLTRMEGFCVAFADHCLAATEAFRRRLVERGRPPGKVTVLLNSPDPRIFFPREGANGREEERTLIFHGTVTERSGVEAAIRAAEEVRRGGQRLRFVILGDGDFLPEVRRLAAESDRPDWIDVRGPVPLESIPQEIAAAHLGIVPNRGGPFADLALPTRILEYLSMDRAVVASRSPAIADLFAESDLLFYDAEDHAELVRVLGSALASEEQRRHCVTEGGRVAKEHSWDVERRIYLDVVGSLTSGAAGAEACSSA